ncbi:cell division protein SepF [Corynebacterium terpenotabidum]|uniref:Cell division protein n=1 Tax=Corynebacterium terpenotabidum Y-11 TaxID=1200352 RepID=S4XDI3_9CORY|nr:cell division protein SepF [Corynebacterium terpenotabidum]AGP30589.1 cell division protein [Corynebacterium terpenotabidum Y-11]
MAEGFIEKTKGFFGFGAIDSYDDIAYGRDDFDDYSGHDERSGQDDRYSSAGTVGTGRHSHAASVDEPDRDRYGSASATAARRSASVGERRPAFSSTPEPRRDAGLVIVDVRSYRDAGKVTPELRRGDIVAFHLGALDKPEANQFLAFVMGLSAGLDAKVEKLSGPRNFAVVPSGAQLTYEVQDALADKLAGER